MKELGVEEGNKLRKQKRMGGGERIKGHRMGFKEGFRNVGRKENRT